VVTVIVRNLGHYSTKLRQQWQILLGISPKSSFTTGTAEVDSLALVIGENVRIYFHIRHDGTNNIRRLRVLRNGHSVLMFAGMRAFFIGIDSRRKGKENYGETDEPQAFAFAGTPKHLFVPIRPWIVFSDHNADPDCFDIWFLRPFLISLTLRDLILVP
jgi:hypothetical protein